MVGNDLGKDNHAFLSVPVWQVVGFKNSGKTTLMTMLIGKLKQSGLMNIFTLKHDQHGFELDQQEKDSWKHSKAGASGVWLTSARQSAFFVEHQAPPATEKLLALIDQLYQPDIFLLEGFKQDHFNKIVLIRDADDRQLINDLSYVKAVVFWRKQDLESFVESTPYATAFLIEDELAIWQWFKNNWQLMNWD